ncbi:MAG: glycosyltransferase family 4 protein [Desulfobacteria bacterium]
MNILFVSDVSISEVIGGAERVLYEQATGLARRGHDVHILTRKLPDHKSNQEIIQGVREWRYDLDQSNAFAFLVSTLLNCKRLFDSLQNQYPFDCINFHQPFSAIGVIHSPASKKIKRIYTCLSLSFEEFRSRNPKPKGVIRRILYFLNVQARKFIERRVLNKSGRIVVLSRFTQDKLWCAYKIPSEKMKVVPGGVDLHRFYPAADRAGIRQCLNIPQKKMILFSVRNLVPRMGLKNLIYAIKEVVKIVPDIYFILGGKGPLKNDLILLSQNLGIENHIHFTGFIPEEELPDYYRSADIFILPTLELEGFGLVTLEALASGVPVLGTPIGGTKEILGRLDPKYIFRDTQPESMAALIIETCQRFKNNPGLWQDVSSLCRSFVEANYSWEKNVDATEKIFSES